MSSPTKKSLSHSTTSYGGNGIDLSRRFYHCVAVHLLVQSDHMNKSLTDAPINNDEAPSNTPTYIILAAIALAVIIAFVVNLTSKGNDGLALSPSDASLIASVRLASTQNALDGKGIFSKTDCEQLKELAVKFNKDADYLASCDSTDGLYLNTVDSSNKQTLTISDDNHTAAFTTDNDLNYLTEYTFSSEPSGGFNKFGGRE